MLFVAILMRPLRSLLIARAPRTSSAASASSVGLASVLALLVLFPFAREAVSFRPKFFVNLPKDRLLASMLILLMQGCPLLYAVEKDNQEIRCAFLVLFVCVEYICATILQSKYVVFVQTGRTMCR